MILRANLRCPRGTTSAIHFRNNPICARHCARVPSVSVRATKAEAAPQPKNAREAVESALRVQKEQKDYMEAVRLYSLAMEMKPNGDEARAALYNMGCALVKLKQWSKATQCVQRAVNDYNLKLSVALKVCALYACMA